MIDQEGYRSNVGIMLCNNQQQLLWARRIGQNSWQFPQGGVDHHEQLEEAMYRELFEEIGLKKKQVSIVARTRDWLRYELPENLLRHESMPLCIGQKQIWFLLLLKSDENQVKLDHSIQPEFDQWRWVDYWYPLKEVVSFKRDVYQQALAELEPYIKSDNHQVIF
ncbi:Adenosine (5')-pentaphospho-(5'')-adenosine pyrophosphohydrolase [hydrothermal vent metagenome]|uniref:Adenosine (5')-pentaphospho-(5'')-adenosine pyrophosphohydrolase n=1 Tax=hydrothermal vent metagenome TaxID=652676 RepID=A0A3B0Y9M5_9ZZZZ